jgi:hypothetical protein
MFSTITVTGLVCLYPYRKSVRVKQRRGGEREVRRKSEKSQYEGKSSWVNGKFFNKTMVKLSDG